MGSGVRARRAARKAATPWQRRRKKALIIVCVFGLLVASWFLWRLGQRKNLAEALNEAAALGVPLTEEAYALKFGPQRSYGLDMAPLATDSPYIEAMESYILPSIDLMGKLPNFRAINRQDKHAFVPYDAATVEAMKAHIQINGETIEKLQAALQAGSPIARGHEFVASIIDILCTAACVRAEEGDGTGFYQLMVDGLVLLRGGDIATGPAAEPLVFSDSTLSLFNVLGRGLRHVRLTEAQLLTLQAHVASGDKMAYWREQQIRGMSNFIIDTNIHWDMEGKVLNMLTGFFDNYRAREIKGMLIGQGLIGLPLAEQDAIVAAQAGAPHEHSVRSANPTDYFAVIHSALDVIRYDGAHGALPPSLDAMVPEYFEAIPQDFWSGGPLRYQAEGRTFSVYSVGGWDREDNGGDQDRDIVFGLTLPPAP